jgi:hypothetical protein
MTVNEHENYMSLHLDPNYPFEYVIRIIGTYRLFQKYFNNDVMNNFIIEGPNCKVTTTMKVTNKVGSSLPLHELDFN